MMMDVDPIKTILVVSNQLNGQELFRVLVHELSIRFDEKLQEGIDNNPELKYEIDYLNQMWRDKKVEQGQIFSIMLDIMTRHGEYMQQFFFDPSELNNNGEFVNKPKREKNPKIFFSTIKKQNWLNKIKKKDFESNIRSLKVAEKYIECLQKNCQYYLYRLPDPTNYTEEWYFMAKEDDLILCYLNK